MASTQIEGQRSAEHHRITRSISLLITLVMLYLASCAPANGQIPEQFNPEPVVYPTPTPSANQQLFFEVFEAVQRQVVPGLKTVTGVYKKGINTETYAALFFDGTERKVVLPDGRTFFLPLLPTDPTAPIEPCGSADSELLHTESVYQIPGTSGLFTYKYDQLYVAWDNPKGSFPGVFDRGDFVNTVACIQTE